MTTFKLNETALALEMRKTERRGGSLDDARLAALADISRQLRADPRGKDLPENLGEAIDVLLRCTALLDAAGEVMPSDDDVGSIVENFAIRMNEPFDVQYKRLGGLICESFRPLFGALRAERNLWKDEGLACHTVLVEIRKALGISGEEWNNAQWSALVPRVKALVEQAKAVKAPAPPSSPERTPYAIADQHALDLALAFLDEVLGDAGLPRVDWKRLPTLGATGWATAWLGQVTLARLAAARVQPIEMQRRIHVAATELERVLFGLFDRAVPMADEAPPSPKGGRRAAT